MSEKSATVVISKFFGKKDGQSLGELAAEIKELSDEDKAQLKAGIEDGTYSY